MNRLVIRYIAFPLICTLTWVGFVLLSEYEVIHVGHKELTVLIYFFTISILTFIINRKDRMYRYFLLSSLSIMAVIMAASLVMENKRLMRGGLQELGFFLLILVFIYVKTFVLMVIPQFLYNIFTENR